MTRIYISYGLTLLSSFAVYWMFGLMSSVAAGYTWVPFSGFLASVFHFGLSSWLFLHIPKAGKVFAIITGVIMCVWPTIAFFGTLSEFDWFQTTIYLIPIGSCGLIFYNHIKTFREDNKPTLSSRIIMTIIPLGLFIAYIIHIVTIIKLGRIAF